MYWQVRTELQELDESVDSTEICAPGDRSPCSVVEGTDWIQGIKEYSSSEQDKSIRYRTIDGNYQPIETYVDNEYESIFGKQDAATFSGFYTVGVRSSC